MARKGKIMTESTVPFYKSLIIRKSFHEKVFSLPKDKIEHFHNDIFCPSNKNSFHNNFVSHYVEF